jgi:RND family efflux transporter MFP subunit
LSTIHTHFVSVAARLAAAGALLVAVACGGEEAPAEATAAPRAVQAEAARLEAIRETITVTGSVTPAPGTDWTITAPEAARIAELPVSEGDTVKEGDVLVRFQVASVSDEALQRQSDARQAATRVEAARASVTQLTGLAEKGLIPQQQLDAARRELQDAESAQRAAEAAEEATSLAASRLVIRARFAGVVAQRWHAAGDLVMGSGDDPVLRVVDPSKVEMTGSVPSDQLSLFSPGADATVFNPSDGQTLAGRVVARPSPGERDGGLSQVRIALPANLPSALPLGSPIQAEIQGDSGQPLLVVPSAAIHRDGDSTFVVIAGQDGLAHRAVVQTGIAGRTLTQITAGLSAGDRVILSGADAVPEGTAIVVR